MDTIYHAINPWWEGRSLEAGISREAYLNRLKDYLAREQIEVFVGSRRTGKTSILKQFI